MVSVFMNVRNSIWHAFMALKQSETQLTVPKSKLKVLTANVGTLLDLYGVEKGLDHFRPSLELDFECYDSYLKREVFSQLSMNMNLAEQRVYEERVEEVCWLICHKMLLKKKKPRLNDTSLYQLFRIFCLLADMVFDPEDPMSSKVLLDTSEATIAIEKLANSLGVAWSPLEFEDDDDAEKKFTFEDFLDTVETIFLTNRQLTEAPLREAIDEVYQTFVKDVIKKGYMLKKGYLLPTLREFWFVLQPCELTYYKTPSEKLICGSIPLNSNCLVNPLSGNTKPQKMLLTTPERTFELAVSDHKSRLQWISAFELAINHSSGEYGYQRGQKISRCRERRRKQNLQREADQAKEMLEKEMEARVAAEQQLHELSLIAKEDNKKLALMEGAKQELERLLAEETQAKKDEEIVRALQARVLSEEWEKREELERLQEEQKQMLIAETLKRQQFQEMQKANEIQLKQAEERLKQLEQERKNLDTELRLARNKIKLSEKSQNILEEQLMEFCPGDKDGEGIRRSLSFVPSSSDKSMPLLQARAATLKKMSKQEKNLSCKENGETC